MKPLDVAYWRQREARPAAVTFVNLGALQVIVGRVDYPAVVPAPMFKRVQDWFAWTSRRL